MRTFAHGFELGMTSLIFGLALLAPPAAIAQAPATDTAAVASSHTEDVTGQWTGTQDFGGMTSYNELHIQKMPTGGLSGIWNGSTLENVKLDGNKLSFDRTMSMGGQDSTMHFEGTLHEGEIQGTFQSPMGDMPTTLRKPQPTSPAVGVWMLEGKGDGLPSTLTLSQDATGKLTGKLGGEPATGILLEGKKLSFTAPAGHFTGTLDGDKLSGTILDNGKQIDVSATRKGAEFIGTWTLEGDFGFGAPTRKLVITPDLKARYALFDGLVPAEKTTVAGDTLTFAIPLNFGGQEATIDFHGKLREGKLDGSVSAMQGETHVVGTKQRAEEKK